VFTSIYLARAGISLAGKCVALERRVIECQGCCRAYCQRCDRVIHHYLAEEYADAVNAEVEQRPAGLNHHIYSVFPSPVGSCSAPECKHAVQQPRKWYSDSERNHPGKIWIPAKIKNEDRQNRRVEHEANSANTEKLQQSERQLFEDCIDHE
jgi:hypothetical protein